MFFLLFFSFVSISSTIGILSEFPREYTVYQKEVLDLRIETRFFSYNENETLRLTLYNINDLPSWVNVSHENQINLLGSLEIDAFALCDVVGGIAFVCSLKGLYIIDYYSDPSSPTEISHYYPSGMIKVAYRAKVLHYFNGNVMAVLVYGSYSIDLVDISDLSSPELITNVVVGSEYNTPTGIAVKNNILYVGIMRDSATDGFKIVDIQNLNEPIVIDEIYFSGGRITNLEIDEDGKFLFVLNNGDDTIGGVTIFNVEDPTNPMECGRGYWEINEFSFSMTLQQNHIIEANLGLSLVVFNHTDDPEEFCGNVQSVGEFRVRSVDEGDPESYNCAPLSVHANGNRRLFTLSSYGTLCSIDSSDVRNMKVEFNPTLSTFRADYFSIMSYPGVDIGGLGNYILVCDGRFNVLNVDDLILEGSPDLETCGETKILNITGSLEDNDGSPIDSLTFSVSINSSCGCRPGWFFPYCNVTKCFDVFSNESSVCNSHGQCIEFDECDCEEGYAERNCAIIPVDPDPDNPSSDPIDPVIFIIIGAIGTSCAFIVSVLCNIITIIICCVVFTFSFYCVVMSVVCLSCVEIYCLKERLNDRKELEIYRDDNKHYEKTRKLMEWYKPKNYTLFPSPKEIERTTEKNDTETIRKCLRDVRFENLEIEERLGYGAFGNVYRCRIDRLGVREGDENFVLKVIFRYTGGHKSPSSELKKYLFDKENLRIPYHPNLVSILYGNVQEIDPKKLPDYLEKNYKLSWEDKGIVDPFEGIMTLMKFHKTDLETYCKKKKREEPLSGLTLLCACRILLGVLKGAKHLHDNSIVHRDLHSKNIFVDSEKGRVWIGDFGCILDLRNNFMNNEGFRVRKDSEVILAQDSYYSKKRMKLDSWGCFEIRPPEIRNCPEEEIFLNFEKFDIYSTGCLAIFFVEKRDENRIFRFFKNILSSDDTSINIEEEDEDEDEDEDDEEDDIKLTSEPFVKDDMWRRAGYFGPHKARFHSLVCRMMLADVRGRIDYEVAIRDFRVLINGLEDYMEDESVAQIHREKGRKKFKEFGESEYIEMDDLENLDDVISSLHSKKMRVKKIIHPSHEIVIIADPPNMPPRRKKKD